jgi:hypothetical protein
MRVSPDILTTADDLYTVHYRDIIFAGDSERKKTKFLVFTFKFKLESGRHFVYRVRRYLFFQECCVVITRAQNKNANKTQLH